MRASICTLGCRVNQYESDAVCERLKAAGFEIVPFGSECEVAIINTCTVTAESDRKSRQHIRRARSASPGAAVIVTGCFAQASPEEAAKLGADAVVGNGDKEHIADIALSLTAGERYTAPVSDIMSACYDSLTVSKPSRARSYIKIEDGCENKCAYCIIPRARGRVRSKPPEAVVKEAEAIGATGCKEIILTGIETASYGADLEGWDLSRLLGEVDKCPGIERIALASLDPSVMREDFVKKIASLSHILPHFHLSVQSACTKTLNRMRRRYTAEKIRENMERVRKYIPDATFSADIIVGFPGESDSDFLESARLLGDLRFLHLHIFPYSQRKGTEAAEMAEQVPESVKKSRCAALAKMQAEVQSALLDEYIEAHRENPVFVLGEKWEDGVTNAHTEHFFECDINTATDCTGTILPVRLTGRRGSVLKGEITNA